MTIGKLYIPSQPAPNRFMVLKLDIVSPTRWTIPLKRRFTFLSCVYVHALNPLLLLKLTVECIYYDMEAHGPEESAGKLLIFRSLMDHVWSVEQV